MNLELLPPLNGVVVVNIFSGAAPGVGVCYRVAVGNHNSLVGNRHIHFIIGHIAGQHQHFSV